MALNLSPQVAALVAEVRDTRHRVVVSRYEKLGNQYPELQQVSKISMLSEEETIVMALQRELRHQRTLLDQNKD